MAEKAENAENATVALDASTRLAVERTRLAHDRTAMAWLRTAISLITFGYGFYKVIDAAQISATTALLLQVRPDLTAEAVKTVLGATAQRIDVGISAQGGRSGPPYPNPATGWGLIDIEAALAAVARTG